MKRGRQSTCRADLPAGKKLNGRGNLESSVWLGTKGKVRYTGTNDITGRINHPSGRTVAFERLLSVAGWMLWTDQQWRVSILIRLPSSLSLFFSVSPSLASFSSLSLSLLCDSDRPSVDSLSVFHTITQRWLSIERKRERERPLKINSGIVIGVNLRHCLFIVPHGD